MCQAARNAQEQTQVGRFLKMEIYEKIKKPSRQ